MQICKVHEDLIPADPIVQAKTIYQRIEQPVNQTNILYRQHLILFGDAVDRYAASQPLPLSKGRDSKTAALEAIAGELKIKKNKVSKRYTHSRLYLKFAKIGGPGSLLSIDGLKSDMENTKDEDIELLCNYRRDRLPTVEEQSQDLNFRVIEYFARNLLAQRVEAAEIAAGRTALAKLICRHIDIEKFVKDGTILPTRISVRNNKQLRHPLHILGLPIPKGKCHYTMLYKASSHIMLRRHAHTPPNDGESLAMNAYKLRKYSQSRY
ncbi:hypothetical protein PtrV1_12149 [Pyrenophora tritici-repentis]|uniref:Uncharacterized protein n=1 Tax=Pyrenophora tritici-repentis TaxID=45151 RepID=A0A316ZN44_9PLEO|nr:hypothetical protein PtrV1_13992 [Pyrenophora tritici-repentis]KAA8613241.1 hypothetical protein PtrV1_12149 [Pyrenophora tritici-repentis]KAF7565207.1 hypothetical protein PtrM4_046410 [Pyrenophora tritici-repentis]KAF7565212.1 hypothetical protein PtrM4_046460 [Pyrenophora tritici-repentis]KAI1680273.1 hypothetical protein KJE20_10913 [Pyrenophora tritici-repentis]